MGSDKNLRELLGLSVLPDFSNFRVGDTVHVDFLIKEGESEKVQSFEGVVIRKKYPSTFTLRKVSFGVGIEKTFPFHSPLLKRVNVIKSGKVRRARLYYLRSLSGKSSRLKEAPSEKAQG